MGALVVKNLGKAYKVYPSRFARLKEWLLPFTKPRHNVKWVLQDINFTINSGEAVGIIGVNGAGKSTLLKMLTGTTQPTTGSIHTSGRVAALLELGIGFHPEFTGRQNAIMAGQLLGMHTDEIRQLMSEIESFAEIGEYIDHPVRVYSSGMQMRLAFSVATAKRPDILIVDEALSVGDAYFQHKSFERIRQFRHEGTTLLIVSHDRVAIQAICDKAILLDGGRLAKEGAPAEVMDFYNALIAERGNSTVVQKKTNDGQLQIVSGTGEATVIEIELLNQHGDSVETVNVGTVVTLRIKVKVHAPIPCLILGYLIKDRIGQEIYGTNSYHLNKPLLSSQVGDSAEYRFTFPANLGPGSYSVSVALTSSATHLANNYEWRDLALLFTVVNVSHPIFVGNNWIEPKLEFIQ